MTANPPEGIYPGCTALSGLGEAGKAIVVQVPGYTGTVRAIAVSPIRSPNGLTLTIDSTGQARVFGVGSAETQSRTTDFLRVRRRSAEEPSRAIVAYILIQSQEAPAAGELNYLSKHYLVLPKIAPVLIPFDLYEYIFVSPAIVYPAGIVSNQYTRFVAPFVSINPNDPDVIHIDFVHTHLTEPPYAELRAGSPLPTQVTSFEYRNGVLMSVDRSASWRSPFFAGLQFDQSIYTGSGYGYGFTASQDWRRILALDPFVSWDSQRDYYFLINDRENYPNTLTQPNYFESGRFYGFEPEIAPPGQTAPASTAHIRAYQLVNPITHPSNVRVSETVTATRQAISGVEGAIGFETPSEYGLFSEVKELSTGILGTILCITRLRSLR